MNYRIQAEQPDIDGDVNTKQTLPHPIPYLPPFKSQMDGIGRMNGKRQLRQRKQVDQVDKRRDLRRQKPQLNIEPAEHI